MNKNFASFNELVLFIKNKQSGGIPVTYQLLPTYAGMALYIGINFDLPKAKYQLNLEWMSLGLDFYGDTLQESYLYQFDDLEKLVGYLHSKYNIAVSNIPIKYEFDHTQFPNPLKNADQKSIFEEAWQRFEHDFKEGIFFDDSIHLVYVSSASQ